jgi:hypothetical protein
MLYVVCMDVNGTPGFSSAKVSIIFRGMSNFEIFVGIVLLEKSGEITKGEGCVSLVSFYLIPFLNQAFTLSAALRRSSPYSLYCLVAARLPSRAHLDLDIMAVS